METEKQKVRYNWAGPDVLEYRKQQLPYGILGKLFGSKENAPSNIAGLVLCILVIPGVILICTQEAFTKEYWQTISPFVGMVLGYLFGKKTT